MFVHTVKLFPIRHRRVGTFFAPDPLHGDTPTEWNLETYRMAARGVKMIRPGNAAMVGGADLFAIKSELDGEPRMLPEAIAVLWRQGEVPAEALPEILRTFGPGLARKRDFDPVLTRSPVWSRLGRISLVLLVLLLVSAAATWVARRWVPAEPEVGFVQQTTAEWLAQPMRANAFVNTNGPIRALATVDLPPGYGLPPGKFERTLAGQGGYKLARVQAASEQRLILVSDYERKLLPLCYPSGVAVRGADLALPAETLAQVSQGARALNTDLVLGNHAVPRLPPDPRRWLRHLWVVPTLLACVFSPLALVSGIIWRRQANRRRQVRDLRQRLGLPEPAATANGATVLPA